MATECSSECGMGPGKSGVPGKVTCSKPSGCNEIDKPVAKVCAGTPACGNWSVGEPTGCSKECGVKSGESGSPGQVTCSISNGGCDESKKPNVKVCPSTPACGTRGLKSNSQTNDNIIYVVVVSVSLVVILTVIVVPVAVICAKKHRQKKEIANNAGTAKTRPLELTSRSTELARKYQLAFDDIKISPDAISIGKRIGQGGGGQVFQGTFNEQSVAFKIAFDKDVDCSDSELVREVVTLSRFRHPNIVHFYGVCEVETHPDWPFDTPSTSTGFAYDTYIVMELCSNGDLQRAAQDYSTSCDERQRWIWQVASAMCFLHSHNVVHRDLKPQNVLLNTERDAKLCDFGSSRSTQTQNFTLGVGTVAYMAPENMQFVSGGSGCGELSDDFRAMDVFSFAILALYVATGKRPYEGFSNEQIIVAVTMKQRPAIPSNYAVSEDSPEEEGDGPDHDSYGKFVSLVQKMWDQEPAYRPEFDVISRDLRTIFGI